MRACVFALIVLSLSQPFGAAGLGPQAPCPEKFASLTARDTLLAQARLAWRGAITDPREHDPAKFAYLVHGASPSSDTSLNDIAEFIRNGPVTGGYLISMSYTTSRKPIAPISSVGFILRVNSQDIIAAHPQDSETLNNVFVKPGMSKEEFKKSFRQEAERHYYESSGKIKRTQILSPAEMIERSSSNPRQYNEVVAVNQGDGAIAIDGIFINTVSKPASEKSIKDAYRLAKESNLPLVDLKRGAAIVVSDNLPNEKELLSMRVFLREAGLAEESILPLILDLRGPKGKLTFKRVGGGTTGGKWFVDEAGVEWFVKPDNVYPELQTSAEVISSRVYEHFGYSSPETVIVNIDGVRHSASKALKPGKLDDLGDKRGDRFEAMRIVAAYLKDWDRLQLGPNNFSYADDRYALFDFGGTLGARAQGAHKPGAVKSPAIGAFEATEDIGVIYDSFQVAHLPKYHAWKLITRRDAAEAILKFRSLTDKKIEDIVKSAQYSDPKDTAYMIEALRLRRKGIIKHLLSRFPE